MRKRSERDDADTLRHRLIGLGEHSFRKSYYPELQERLDELERFRSLLDHTYDIILLVRLPDFDIIDANATACRLLGRELLGARIDEVMDMNTLQFPEEGCMMLTTTMRRVDGTTFPVELTLCIDRYDVASYILIVARDIGERLRAEEGLRRALSAAEEGRDKIDAIVGSVADGLLVADTSGRLLLLNRAAEGLLGVNAEEAVGRPVQEILEMVQEGLPRDRISLLEEGIHDLLLKGSNGAGRILQALTSPIRQRSGRISGTVISLQDRTRDREIDRMKTEFISTAAHEFRTPLTSIQGFSELLLNCALEPSEQREFLTYIHEKSVALGRLVGDLLDIVRIESGQELRFHRAPWKVRELLAQVIPVMRSDGKHHRFDICLDEQETQLLVDRDKIGQVLENLLSNAIKYSPRGTVIRICGKAEGDFYRFSVVDEGIGMSPEEVARVFDKFYRADASNKAEGGIGLGMSIVKGIVEAHHGEIRVDSRPGSGTNVYFTLPLPHEEAPERPCSH